MKDKAAIFMLLLILIGSAAAFSGCISSDDSVKEPEAITITDMAGREVTVMAPVSKVALLASTTINGFAAIAGEGFEDKIVAIGSSLSSVDGPSYERYLEIAPSLDTLPVVGSIRGDTFSIETVLAEEPDVVVIYTSDFRFGAQEKIVDPLTAAGVPVVCIDFTPTISDDAPSYQHVLDSIGLLGTILGEEDKAEEIQEYYKGEVKKVLDVIHEQSPTPSTIYIEGGLTPPEEYSNTLVGGDAATIIRDLGGINIAEGVLEGSSGKLNPEYVLTSDPDSVVFFSRDAPQMYHLLMGYNATAAQVKGQLQDFVDARPGWEDLDAVKSGSIYGIEFSTGQKVFSFYAYQQYAKMIYPDLFSDLDPDEALEKFHEQFLPIDYSGTWCATI